MKATDPIAANVRAGLAARIRCRCGGTKAATSFADLVSKGHDFTAAQLAVVVTAHNRLDDRLVAAGVESEAHRVEWLLWGGAEAAQWAASAAQPLSAGLSIMAAADYTTPMGRLTRRLQAIDDRTVAKVEVLFETLLAQALKATGAMMANLACGPKASNRIRDDLVGLLGAGGYDDLRTTVSNADSTVVPSLLPASLRAQFNEREETQVQRVLEGLPAALLLILKRAQEEARKAIVDELDLPPDVIPVQIVDSSSEDRSRAVLFAVTALFDLARRRLSAPTPETVTVGLTRVVESAVPSSIVRAVTGIAGGLPATSDGVTLSEAGSLIDTRGRVKPTGIATSPRTVETIDRIIAQPTITVNIPAGAELVVTAEWVSTKMEFKGHKLLHGRTWTDETERFQVCAADPGEWPFVSVYRPNPSPDHNGCGCYTTETLSLR